MPDAPTIAAWGTIVTGVLSFAAVVLTLRNGRKTTALESTTSALEGTTRELKVTMDGNLSKTLEHMDQLRALVGRAEAAEGEARGEARGRAAEIAKATADAVVAATPAIVTQVIPEILPAVIKIVVEAANGKDAHVAPPLAQLPAAPAAPTGEVAAETAEGDTVKLTVDKQTVEAKMTKPKELGP